MNINSTIITGYVGKEVEIRYFDSGKVKANLSVAVKRPYARTKDEPPNWINCELWGKLAEFAHSNLSKGKQVALKGRFGIQHWQDSNSGVLRSKPFLNGYELEILSPKSSSNVSY